jgi:hypothetical protein
MMGEIAAGGKGGQRADSEGGGTTNQEIAHELGVLRGEEAVHAGDLLGSGRGGIDLRKLGRLRRAAGNGLQFGLHLLGGLLELWLGHVLIVLVGDLLDDLRVGLLMERSESVRGMVGSDLIVGALIVTLRECLDGGMVGILEHGGIPP